MEAEAVTLQRALEALSSSADPKSRKEADTYLKEFQRKRVALDVSLAALQTTDAVPQLRFYAAQTLHQKASRDSILGTSTHNSSPHKNTESLLAEQFHSLVSPVVTLTAKEAEKPVRVQLCLALASLLLRSEGDPAESVSGALSCLQGAAPAHSRSMVG